MLSRLVIKDKIEMNRLILYFYVFLAYNECLNEEKRGQILKFCLTANHSQLRVTDCSTCFKEYLKIGNT